MTITVTTTVRFTCSLCQYSWDAGESSPRYEKIGVCPACQNGKPVVYQLTETGRFPCRIVEIEPLPEDSR